MELKKEIVSLLFSSGKVMNEEELADLTNSSKKEVKEALESLKQDYDARDSSLMLVQSGETWKLNVREKYMNLVTKIVADTELSFPVLETLAVVAYKAPVVQSEIIKIRGTNAYEHIGVLANEEFVEKKKEGRSFRLNLTPKFFKYFDVSNDKDIKEAFQDVKIPEKKIEKIEEKEEKTENKDDKKEGEEETKEEEKISIENNKPDHDFIDEMEDRLKELRQRNDELDQDELFKRQGEVNREMEEEKIEEKEEKEEEVEEEAVPAEQKEEETTEEPAEEPATEEEPAEEEPAEEPEEEKKED